MQSTSVEEKHLDEQYFGLLYCMRTSFGKIKNTFPPPQTFFPPFNRVYAHININSENQPEKLATMIPF